jgi:AcrR family transcriptional regulator
MTNKSLIFGGGLMPKETFFNLPEEKRKAILDIAIEEFAHNIYKDASISNIAARAGVAKGSLYQYFEDKRELYFYLLQLAGEEKKAFLAGKKPPDPYMSLFDYLRWLMKEGASFELSNPGLAQVAYRGLFSDRPFGDEPTQQILNSVKDYYGSLVDMGKAQGCIEPAIDRDLAIFLFESVFNRFGRYLTDRLNIDLPAVGRGEKKLQDFPIDDLADQVIGVLERGMAPIHQSKQEFQEGIDDSIG